MEIDLETKQKASLDQGKAYSKALDLMKHTDKNSEKEVDDYIVSLAIEKAEGMYKPQPAGDLQWQIPAPEQNLHLEIVVRDKKDLRFIPDLAVNVKLMGSNRNLVEEKVMPFLWHPFLYHYGANWSIPAEADYLIGVTIKEPNFGRHDQDKGKRYGEEVSLELGPIHLIPGRKEYGPE